MDNLFGKPVVVPKLELYISIKPEFINVHM